MNVGQRGPRRVAGARRVRNVGEPTVRAGLMVTDIVTTLFDISACSENRPSGAGVADEEDLVELAVESALRERFLGEATLRDEIFGAPHQRPGRRHLARLLTRRPVGAPPTESYLETRGLQLVRAAGLPEPQRQVEIFDSDGNFVGRVDFLVNGTAIEFDGREHHDRSESFARDRARWNALLALGLRPLVFTFDDVVRAPRRTMARLQQVDQFATDHR